MFLLIARKCCNQRVERQSTGAPSIKKRPSLLLLLRLRSYMQKAGKQLKVLGLAFLFVTSLPAARSQLSPCAEQSLDEQR